ncbi:homoserine dehydrogenase [Methylophilaceae bacterium]|nr:homoserine dehydrogenase [Betaproteobacteria bacterium]MDC0114705.1 homoserine dehydrogenase [Methylophilaceae bacterium]MDC1114212.1 homoserine dehydrogenase [Methylophilaceae bacterium]MDC1281040.1 homoserine dehydrogenase [Methylophilaceae bacterium]
MNVGLIGVGTVGGGTYKVLTENFQEIFHKTGIEIKVTLVADKNVALAKQLVGTSIPVVSDALELIDSKEVDIVVELIGGTGIAKDLVKQALLNGKHVVTANKALIAMHGKELFAAAENNNVQLAYEAAVAGGIPIIKALREGLAANKIEWVAGIINGTTNYILTEMKENNLSFDVALKQAQELGFAEADPTFDIEGVDAAHKITIMASIAFGIPINFDGVFVEGISNLNQKDITYAEELGYRIKLLAIAKSEQDSVEIRVHPTLIPEKRLVANVSGPMNAVLVKGNMVGPTLYYGAGAGAEPTASAVVADIIDIARQSKISTKSLIPSLGFMPNQIKNKKLLAIEEVWSEFYLRLTMENKSGLLAKITNIFANHKISIDALVHKEVQEDNQDPDIFLVSSKVQEHQINKVIKEIEALPENKDKIIKLRIEELK